MKRKYNIKDIKDISKEIVEMIIDNDYTVIHFSGDLGSGKTTLIKSICEQMGVQDNVNSPTFIIMNEYNPSSDSKYKKILHIDAYRFENENEAVVLDREYLLEDGNLLFIEWPERLPDILPHLIIKLKNIDEYNREIEII